MKKILLIFIFVFIISVIALYFLFSNGILWFVYPDKKYQIRGLDISHHQGNINWEKLSKYNFKFIYIKATEGDDFKDMKFKDYREEAKKTGLITGAYHYYSLRIKGKIQAKNFIQTVSKEENSLPPVIDLEFGGNSKYRPGKEEFIKELKDYIAEIETYYNKKPVLYVTYKFYNSYLTGEFSGYKIWIRDIFKHPKNLDHEWIFWQYHSRAKIEGITGFVDLNIFKGNENQFMELIK